MKQTRDQIFFFGRYSLALHKGGEWNDRQEETVFDGSFTFSSGNSTYTGHEVRRSSGGTYSFQINVFPSDYAIGLCYNIEQYDKRLRRSVIRSLWSDIFSWNSPVLLNVHFTPGQADGTYMALADDMQVETFYQTIYGKTVRVELPKAFSFKPACRLSADGMPIWYFSPDGAAKVLSGGKLRLGLSGSEYMDLKAGDIFRFHSCCPAFIGKKKTNHVPTTSYVSFPESGYHTQPQEANYYVSGGKINRVAILPALRIPDAVFPSFPYWKMREGKSLAEEAENTQIAPLRRASIEIGLARLKKKLSGTYTFAVTGNGMKICMDGEEVRWLRIAASETSGPGLAFSRLTPAFYLGLLSNSLFLVLTDLKERAGTPYWIDESRLEQATQKGYKDTARLTGLSHTAYTDREALKASVEQTGAVFNEILLDAFDVFNLKIAGWRFLLSPRLWESSGSLFVVKTGTTESLTGQMGTPERFSVSLTENETNEADKRLKHVISQNRKLEDPLLASILYEKQWTGCVAFEIQSDLAALPEELGFLKHGIDPGQFKASYVAFESQYINDGDLSAANVLISYEDGNMLSFEDYHEFAFKVRSLRLKIVDGTVQDFHVKVELLINSLFGSPVTGNEGMYGNSLVFNGSLQTDEEGSYYDFVLEGPQTYYLQNSMIEFLSVTSASLRTEGNNCRFRFDGSMKLYCNEQMDILSYENISFKGLEVLINSATDGYVFSTSMQNFTFTTENVQSRKGSLAACFPVTVKSFIVAGNECKMNKFRDLKIAGTIGMEELGSDWNGITWTCSMGNLGGLAESMKFEMTLLTAWNNEMKMFCGIALTSAFTGDRWTLPLQGIMELGFSRIELRKKESKDKTEWYFRFRDFSLSIMGKKFPETSNSMYLISDENMNPGFYGVMEG